MAVLLPYIIAFYFAAINTKVFIGNETIWQIVFTTDENFRPGHSNRAFTEHLGKNTTHDYNNRDLYSFSAFGS